MFFDFNTLLIRSVDFAVGVLISVSIKKRALALLRLAQEEQPRGDLLFALQESLIFTLGREFQIGVDSKHSRKFHFHQFSHFIDTVKETLEANKDWNVDKLEDFFVRLKFMAKRQSRLKDTFFFWIAHAKLLR